MALSNGVLRAYVASFCSCCIDLGLKSGCTYGLTMLNVVGVHVPQFEPVFAEMEAELVADVIV